MPFCPTGSPQPKPGVAETVVFTTTAAATVLGNTGNPWLIALSAALGVVTYETITFCGSDPPSQPTFTAADATALLQLNDPAAAATATAKLLQYFGAAVWDQLCQCSTGTTPNPITPVSAPTGWAAVNPPVTGTPGVVPCWSQSAPLPTGPVSPTNPTTTNALFPGNPPVLYLQSGTIPFYTPPSPLPVQLTITGDLSADANAAHKCSIAVCICVSPTVCGATIASMDIAAPGNPSGAPTHGTVTATIPANTVAWNIELVNEGVGLFSVPVALSFMCAGQSPLNPVSACCPPDATTSAILNQILQYVMLLQRQVVPFAYIAGAAHTGLSGNGALTVQGLIGLRVNITTVPPRLGSQLGDPVTLWDAGWINLGTTDGFGPRIFISSNPFLELGISGAITRIGYSIPGDVTVTITELVREA